LKQSAERKIHGLASALVGRAKLAARLGKSFGDKRDIYTALGYTRAPAFEDYAARYERQDIAKRIVDAPVKASWRLKPTITETEDKETQFEKAWKVVLKTRNVYHYLSRVDKISGIGQYGVLLLGFDDGKKVDEEVEKASSLLYLRPFAEDHATIQTWERASKNERYGKPLTYNLSVSSEDKSTTHTVPAHWSRIIHVAEDLYENDTHGTPRLKAILNRLQDLELVSGGSAEMFWRGGFPGYGFKVDPEHSADTQDMEALEDEIQEYIHGLKRYIRLQGISVEDLAVQIASPEGHFKIIIALIGAATGIPQRILVGSERGELASSQDETSWREKVEERRIDHVESMILRPTIDRLIDLDVLPMPGEEGYTVEWPDLFAPSEKEQADVAKIKTEALASYSNASTASLLIPPIFYMQKFLNLTQEEIDQIKDLQDQMSKEEQAEIKAEAKAREAEGDEGDEE